MNFKNLLQNSTLQLPEDSFSNAKKRHFDRHVNFTKKSHINCVHTVWKFHNIPGTKILHSKVKLFHLENKSMKDRTTFYVEVAQILANFLQ